MKKSFFDGERSAFRECRHSHFGKATWVRKARCRRAFSSFAELQAFAR